MRNYLFGMVLLSNLAVAAEGDEFGNWLNDYQGEYQSYLEQRDKDFSHYLNSQWREFSAFAGLVRDPVPKPVQLPIAKRVAEQREQDREVETKPGIEQPIAIVAPPVRVAPAAVKRREINKPRRGTTKITFYGEPLFVTLPATTKQPRLSSVNKSSIATFWKNWAGRNHKVLVGDLNRAKKELALNDWATLRLSYEISRSLYASENERLLFTWFLFSKAGYRVKVAHDGTNLFLLLLTRQKIYEQQYLTVSGERYYIFRFGDNKKAKRFYSFEQDYRGAERLLDMTLPASNLISSSFTEKRRNFTFNGKKYSVSYPLNGHFLDFLSSYPQSEFNVYFNSSPLTRTSQTLLSELAQHMQGMERETGVNFLLKFVQTAFEYKSDEVNFGEENYLFPDETLYFQYSDCEDRSFLFAWLVKNLLNIEVIGLTYPGHVATAVLLPGNRRSDTVQFNGKRYLVSDPTYINATIGMAMPQFKNKNPAVIRIQ